MPKTNIIMLSGGFDPLHVGHVEMINRARHYGDVIIILNSDAWLQRKKGRAFMPFEERKVILENLANVRRVVGVDDSDGTVCAALREHKPNYFGNGGDRTFTNTPELDVCDELHIEPVFELGKKIQSSSELVTRAGQPIEREWGRYTLLYNRHGVQVKILEVDPGKATSLQRHGKRNEHWIWPNDEREFHPAGEWHQLHNPFVHDKMHVVEVQTGTYFGEDDIQRVPLSRLEFEYRVTGAIPTRVFKCHIPDLQNYPGIWKHVLAEIYNDSFVEFVDFDDIEILPTGK